MSKENARGMQDDVISRQAAIDAVNYVMVMKGIRSGKSITAEAVDCAKRIIADNIRQLPPAEPKRGKWIRTGSGSLYDHYECSECGKAPKWECMGDNRWKIAFTDFCPNCGSYNGGEYEV